MNPHRLYEPSGPSHSLIPQPFPGVRSFRPDQCSGFECHPIAGLVNSPGQFQIFSDESNFEQSDLVQYRAPEGPDVTGYDGQTIHIGQSTSNISGAYVSLKILELGDIEVQACGSVIATTAGNLLIDECLNQSLYGISLEYPVGIREYDYLSSGQFIAVIECRCLSPIRLGDDLYLWVIGEKLHLFQRVIRRSIIYQNYLELLVIRTEQ